MAKDIRTLYGTVLITAYDKAVRGGAELCSVPVVVNFGPAEPVINGVADPDQTCGDDRTTGIPVILIEKWPDSLHPDIDHLRGGYPSSAVYRGNILLGGGKDRPVPSIREQLPGVG